MSAIVSTKICHRVQFASNPKNRSFPTYPEFVETRLIRDLTYFPKEVKYVSFDDVIETVVRLPNGSTVTVYSQPFNESGVYHVAWSAQKQLMDSRHCEGRISVHENLQGKVFVSTSTAEQDKEQRAA